MQGLCSYVLVLFEILRQPIHATYTLMILKIKIDTLRNYIAITAILSAVIVWLTSPSGTGLWSMLHKTTLLTSVILTATAVILQLWHKDYLDAAKIFIAACFVGLLASFLMKKAINPGEVDDVIHIATIGLLVNLLCISRFPRE